MTDAERKALARSYAEDRNLAAHRAEWVASNLATEMPEAVYAWVTSGQNPERVQRMIFNALFRLYRTRRTRDVAAALAPALVGYTTAPEGYDHDYVKTVETFTAPSFSGRGTTEWRKIEVYDLDRFQNYQLPRYSSGLYGFQERDPREEQRERQEEEVPVKQGRYEVRIAQRWVNQRTGATAGIGGASPWTHPGERADWHLTDVGWTIYDTNEGTFGSGRPPFASKGEAQRLANRENEAWEKIQKRQQEEAWWREGRRFVDEEIGKAYAKKRKKGYKPSYSDNERLSALEVMRDILDKGPSRDTEERFKSMKLAFLGMGSSAKGRR